MTLAPVRTALIPAAGLATRALPASKVIPKTLFPIGDRPSVQYLVEEAHAAGIRRVVFVLAEESRSFVERHFAPRPDLRRLFDKRAAPEGLRSLWRLENEMVIQVVIQDRPGGLGHAVAQGRDLLHGEERFAVLLGDEIVLGNTPALGDLIRAADAHGAEQALSVQEVPLAHVSRYGIVAGTPLAPTDDAPEAWRVSDMVEKPAPEAAPSRWAITGRYVLSHAVFEALDATAPDAKGELQLTHALRSMLPRHATIAAPLSGLRLDIGNPEGFARANLAWLQFQGVLESN